MIGIFRPRLQRLAAREGLGRVQAVIGLQPSTVLALVFWSPAILVAPVVLVRLLLGHPFDWEAVVTVLVGCPLLWGFVRSEGLAVCDGGLLVGSFLPFLKPFRLRWDEIDLRTLALVTPYARVYEVMAPLGGTGWERTSSSRRGPATRQCALTLAGPPVAHARLGRYSMGAARPETIHGGALWCIGVGDRRATRTREALVTAVAAHHPALRSEVEARLSRVIALDHDPFVAATQLPGFDPVRYYGGPGGLEALRRRAAG